MPRVYIKVANVFSCKKAKTTDARCKIILGRCTARDASDEK